MKKHIYILLLIVISFVAKAQQLPHYSNYMVNDYVMNPAIGGSNSYFEGKSNNRYQWVGITDAPRTYILSVNGPTKSLKMGLGGLLFTDIVGPTRRTGFYLSYAYHLKLNEKIRLSFGITAGLLQFAVDGSKITLRDPSDAVISNGIQTALMPDFGAGFYLYSTDKKWYVGASVPQIMQNKIKFYEYSTSTLSKLATHYYATAGYKFDVNDDFKIEPSTCIKYVQPAPLQFDIGLRGIYKDKYWIGGAFRYLDAISAMVGITLQENILFAYSYDFTTTAIRKYSTGTHEIMIGLKFHQQKSATETSARMK
ncbi:MAG: type IX secretion system membrane protein PorP/SprF [Bacteroidia bacterium]|nr:type IX secretion system membrane protein PorP/SprF [Bacteroidia bacterium]